MNYNSVANPCWEGQLQDHYPPKAQDTVIRSQASFHLLYLEIGFLKTRRLLRLLVSRDVDGGVDDALKSGLGGTATGMVLRRLL